VVHGVDTDSVDILHQHSNLVVDIQGHHRLEDLIHHSMDFPPYAIPKYY
jgi:hypothetical protein